MTKKTIHADYSNPEEFWKAMEHAYKNPAISFADKKILVSKLIAKKINETAWKRLGGDRYLGQKDAFYYNLESRLASIYLKMVRRESIANQVYKDLRDFLKVYVYENRGKTETTNQNINDQQQPILALGDMTGGSYGAFHNRADWLKTNRTASNQSQIVEGLLEHFETETKDGKEQYKRDEKGNLIKREKPGLKQNWKQFEERVGVGAILNALQFLETDLEEEFREIQRDLMSPFDFSEGQFYTDYATGRVKFKSWEEIEDETDPDVTQRREVKSFRYDKNLSYPENLRNREVILEQELRITTHNRELVQKRIHAGECFIEAWETPLELKPREEFDKIKEEVVGFEEFIEEIGNYLSTVRKKRKSGKQVLPPQRFYLILGDPGIGKTYIAGKIADYLGKQKIKINCATAFDTEIIGREQTYRDAGFGDIAQIMIDGRDSAPVIVFDEADKCRDENVLNIISVLFDNSTNVHDFKDTYLGFPIPMNRCIMIATANNEKKLMQVADFLLSRCTRVVLKPLTYLQRIELARRGIRDNLKELELDQYITKATDNILLKKCLVKERGIRQTLINTKKITDQIDDLDTKYGGDRVENAGKDNIGSNVNFISYNWMGLIVSDGLDPNCPAKRGEDHIEDHKCFEPQKIEGWADNMGHD